MPGGGSAAPSSCPAAHQRRNHQLLSTLRDIRREQHHGKILRCTRCSLNPSQQGPTPHSQQDHVTGPTSSCAGAYWAGRAGPAPAPAALGWWILFGLCSPLSHSHCKLCACCCSLMLRPSPSSSSWPQHLAPATSAVWQALTC